MLSTSCATVCFGSLAFYMVLDLYTSVPIHTARMQIEHHPDRLAHGGSRAAAVIAASVCIGGKLAQLGGRLITSTAKKLSKMFFEKFEKIMSGEEKLEEAS